MEFIESLNRRVKKLGFFNIQLVKISSWFFALAVLKLVPGVLNIHVGWFVVMLVVLAARPFYVGWLKHDGPETEKRPANKLGFVDLQLVKIANWLFAVIVVKMFPAILNADIGWYVALLVLFAIAPFYAAWIKNDGQAMNPA